MKILLATGNEGKKKELLEVLGEIQGIRWLSLKDFSPVKDPEEHGQTFRENALLKAKYFAEKFQIPTLGEDSGIILEAFPEKFGVRTRREISSSDDVDWLRQFLELLEGEKNRKATFFSALAYYDPITKKQHMTQGTCRGEITEFPQAPLEKGIPVSAVFLPEGKDIVYSAMSKEEKNSISHRGESTHQMAEKLKKIVFSESNERVS